MGRFFAHPGPLRVITGRSVDPRWISAHSQEATSRGVRFIWGGIYFLSGLGLISGRRAAGVWHDSWSAIEVYCSGFDLGRPDLHFRPVSDAGCRCRCALCGIGASRFLAPEWRINFARRRIYFHCKSCIFYREMEKHVNFVLYAKLAFTGAVILGLELVASRVLTPFFGVSLNVWSSILAVTLIALAIGYKFGGYLSNRLSSSHLLVYFVGGGALSATWMNLASYTYPQVLSELSTWDFVSGSIAACVYILFIPLVVFSSLNSVLVALLNIPSRENSGDNDHKAGSVFFVSTIGSVIGVFVVTYSLLPNFSNYNTYAILSTLSAVFTFILALFVREIHKTPKIFLYVGSLFMALIAANTAIYGGLGPKLSTFQQSSSAPRWTVVSREPSFYGNHTVVDFTAPNGAQWRGLLTGGLVNNRVYKSGVSASSFTHALELLSFSGNMPPKTALILGLGAGIVATNLSKKGVSVDVVELDATVAKIAQEYFSFNDSRISVTIEDARTFVSTCPKTYDVVVVDLFRGDGIPSHVVSKEFFEDVKACISNGGAIVMNAFYGTKNLASKKALFKTLTSVFDIILVFESPADPKAESQQGYILARNSNSNWSFTISLSGLPNSIVNELKPAFKNLAEYRRESEFLKDTVPIYDNWNDWKRRTSHIDTAFRKRLTRFIPWQVLLD